MLATWFFSKEVERLKFFGLDYQSTIYEKEQDEEFSDILGPDKIEMLKMLTILDLDNKVDGKGT